MFPGDSLFISPRLNQLFLLTAIKWGQTFHNISWMDKFAYDGRIEGTSNFVKLNVIIDEKL